MRVLVTGGNGHVGTNLVAELLAAGHSVRASVRALGDEARTAHLRALGPVELVQADLFDEASLKAAITDQEAVLHAAAVYELLSPGRAEAIVRASVQGIDAAFRAAASVGVKRIILTSSTVTLPLRETGEPPADESHWTSDLRVPYVRAKTEGERRAWALAAELDLDLATVLPGACGGPGFQRNTPTIDFIEAVMKGALQLGAPPINYPYVDVRDVARAHRMVLEQKARGRYIVVNDRQPTVTEIAQTMHAIDPSIPSPLFTLPAFVMPLLPFLERVGSLVSGAPRSVSPELAAMLRGRVWNISNAGIRRDLGWSPSFSIKESIADTLAAIRARADRSNPR